MSAKKLIKKAKVGLFNFVMISCYYLVILLLTMTYEF